MIYFLLKILKMKDLFNLSVSIALESAQRFQYIKYIVFASYVPRLS